MCARALSLLISTQQSFTQKHTVSSTGPQQHVLLMGTSRHLCFSFSYFLFLFYFQKGTFSSVTRHSGTLLVRIQKQQDSQPQHPITSPQTFSPLHLSFPPLPSLSLSSSPFLSCPIPLASPLLLSPLMSSPHLLSACIHSSLLLSSPPIYLLFSPPLFQGMNNYLSKRKSLSFLFSSLLCSWEPKLCFNSVLPSTSLYLFIFLSLSLPASVNLETPCLNFVCLLSCSPSTVFPPSPPPSHIWIPAPLIYLCGLSSSEFSLFSVAFFSFQKSFTLCCWQLPSLPLMKPTITATLGLVTLQLHGPPRSFTLALLWNKNIQRECAKQRKNKQKKERMSKR